MERLTCLSIVLLAWIYIVADGQILEDEFLTVVDGRSGKLYQLSLNGTIVNEIRTSQQIHPVAVDYDPINKRVFWTDVGRGSIVPKIYSAMINGSDQKTVLALAPSSSPEGIAVDPKMQLIFYADNGPDSIRVLSYDGLYQKTLINSAHNPRDLKIDPVNRHIYWTDWGTGTIERSNYDGTGREVVYSRAEAWINCLALDLNLRQMYWTDAKNDLVGMADMDTGDNVDTVVDRSTAVGGGGFSPHYYGVAVDSQYIYLTDWNSPKIVRSNRDGTNYTTVGGNKTFTMLNGIHAYTSSMYKYGSMNPCTDNKGGCSDLCLAYEGSGYACACNQGLTLDTDNRTCKGENHTSGPDLVWLEYDGSSSSYIRGVKGEPRAFIRSNSLESWRIHSPLWHWKAVDFSYQDQLLYMVDGFDNYIAQLNLDGSLSLTVVNSGLSSSVNGLSYDWLSKSLYWTDGLYNWIRVSSAAVGSDNVKTLIQSDLDSPHGIVVYPGKGLLFWTDWGEMDRIERSTLAGENRQVLVTAPEYVNRPKGITIDYDNDRIYWCNQYELMSATIDGEDVKKHYTSSEVNLGSITFHDNYVVAIDEGRGNSRPYIIFLNINSPNIVPKLGLDKSPTDVVMYHKNRQPNIDTAMLCGSCSQLCVSEAAFSNHTRCMCRDGYRLLPDGVNCAQYTDTQPGLIFSMGDRICAVPFEDVHAAQSDPEKFCFFDSPSTNGHSKYTFTALDYDYQNAMLFFAEVKYNTRTIRSASLNDKQNNSVVVYGVGEVYGLAYDYFGENLYWADHTLGQIWMARYDGSHQKTLLSDRIKPRALLINMKHKRLYWSEMKDEHRGQIMSCDLAGSNVHVLVDENIYNITGLTIDNDIDRLYWVDHTEQEIEYITLDDGERTKVQGLSNIDLHVYDLAFYHGFVGVTDMDSGNASGLHVLERESGYKPGAGVKFKGHSAAYDVVAYAPDYQKAYVGNSAVNCGFENGFCEQLCVQITDTQRQCLCMDGMVLNSDDMTCKTAILYEDQFLLVADDYRHTIHLVNPSDLTTYSSLPLPPHERPISAVYDHTHRQVYWADFHSGTIKRMNINGTDIRIVKYNTQDSRIDGLAYEPTSALLYYTDTGRGEIGVISSHGDQHKVLHSDPVLLTNIRAIVLDVTHGYMYYTTRGSDTARIVRADLTSFHPTDLITVDITWPSGLTLDINSNVLYWIDSKTGRIEACNTDGTGRRTVLGLNDTADPFAITLVGERLYWTDWKHRGLFSVNTDGSGFTVSLQRAFPGLNDIHYINTQAYPDVSSCSVNNGECSALCIPTPGTPTCVCPDHSNGSAVIPGDDKNCDASSCPTSIPNGNFMHGCSMLPGASCTFKCNDGFGVTYSGKLTCEYGLYWDKDLASLCISATCPSVILTPPYSVIDESDPSVICPRTNPGPGAQCKFRCVEGYTKTGGDTVSSCTDQLAWEWEPLQCTHEEACVSLGTQPSHSLIYPSSCHQAQAMPGQTCHYACSSGYVKTDGDTIRSCRSDKMWTGDPIICSLISTVNPAQSSTASSTVTPHPTSQLTHPAVKPTIGTGAVTGQQSDSNKTMVITVTIAVILALAIIVAFVSAVVYVMYKRSTKPPFARYRDSTNFDGTCTTDLEPVVDRGDISPCYDAHSDKVYLDGSMPTCNNNVYVSQNGKDHMKADGSIAFSNPGYADTNGDLDLEENSGNNLYTEIVDDAMTPDITIPEDVHVRIPEPESYANDRTAFSNPMYSNIPPTTPHSQS